MGGGLAFRLATAAVLLATTFAGAAAADERVLRTPHFVIGYRDIDDAKAKSFAAKAETAFAAITAYLKRPYAKTIRISVGDRYFFPHFDRETRKIVVPANRLLGDAPGPPLLRGRGTAIALVLTTVVARSTNKNWGGFLDIGLAVFMQEKFGDRSYPSMGRDLHEEAARLAASYGRFIPLVEVEWSRTRRTRLARKRRLAYLEEGSFVRFLIEWRGLKKFMEVYDGGSFEDSYGVGIIDLEQRWLRTIKPPNP